MSANRLIWAVTVPVGLLWMTAHHKHKRRDNLPPGKTPRSLSRPDCQRIPESIYKRPDPLIYSQSYLMAQGLAVTWDNPDITVEKEGKVVDSHNLSPNTEYEVVARIWNSSIFAPVAGLEVGFLYRAFGIGAAAHSIGHTTVNLGVKGSSSCPSFARHLWKTPDVPGHYCLQVELYWFDDAIPGNNIGQHNTDVQLLNSPNAVFTVPVFNPGKRARTIRFRADGYQLPALPECQQASIARHTVQERIAALVLTHGYQLHDFPHGWEVRIDPPVLELAPMQSAELSVRAVAPEGYRGRQPININGFAGEEHIGGVTLYAASAGDR